MGLLDKLKSAVNVVTGGAAKVSIEVVGDARIGAPISVRVTLASTGGEVKSDGVFVDFAGEEELHIPKRDDDKLTEDYRREHHHSAQSFRLSGPFVLGAGEQKVVEGSFSLPPDLQPSFAGRWSKNHYLIRGRLEARGNDPDSGYQPIRVIG